MGFEIINKIKKEKGLTNAQLSKLSGVTLSTLDKITSGANTNPKLDTLQAICRALGCRLDDFDDTPRTEKITPLHSSEAMKLAKDFDTLDAHGQAAVRGLMDVELDRMKDLAALAMAEPEEAKKIIPLYLSPSAAGIASPIFNQEYQEYALQSGDPKGAVFAVKVQGDSMEPYFPDGSIVFCNKYPMHDGDVGVFMVDGGGVIKQYHKEDGVVYLFSLNRQRDDADVILPPSSGRGLVCQGRVITKRKFPIPGK